MKPLDVDDTEIELNRKAKRRKQQRKRRERQANSDNVDLQEDMGLHYDDYHGWIKDDR